MPLTRLLDIVECEGRTVTRLQKGQRGVSVATSALTEQSHEALQLAAEWAQTRGATRTGAEHLLLALVDEEHGVAAVVLRSCGVDLAKLLQILPPPAPSAPGALARPDEKAVPPADPAFERARALAADEARRLGHPYVETGHLLLGLLATGDAIALGMLEGCGATPEQVCDETLQMLSAPATPTSERSRIEDIEVERVRRRSAAGRFTESATRVLAVAAEEAQQLGSPTVESAHLLLALAQVEGTIASVVLAHLGVDAEQLRSAISNGAQRGAAGEAAKTLGPSGKATIERAVAESRRLRHRQIGPGHLLLALSTMPDGGTVDALHALGVPAPTVRALTLQYMGRARGSRRLQRMWALYRVVRVIFNLIVLAVTLSAALAVGFILAKLGFVSNAFGAALLVLVFLIIVARLAQLLALWRRRPTWRQ